MTTLDTASGSAAASGADFDSPEHQARLAELYRDFDAVGMTPLWRTREGLMPVRARAAGGPASLALGGAPSPGRPQRRAGSRRPRR